MGAAPTPMDPGQERTVAALGHLAALVMYLGIPFGNILGPLVVWLLGRSRSAFVDDQGKEAVNFQVSVTLYFLALVLVLVVAVIAGRGEVTGLIALIVLAAVAMVALALFQLVMTIVAGVRASGGERFRYPLTLRLVQ